jgi:hypothetical protein
MINYLEAIRVIENHFNGFSIVHIPRAQNDEADKLVKEAARKQPLPLDVFYEEITRPSVRQKKETQINAIFSEDWRSPIIAYLRGHFELTDKTGEKECPSGQGATWYPKVYYKNPASPHPGLSAYSSGRTGSC